MRNPVGLIPLTQPGETGTKAQILRRRLRHFRVLFKYLKDRLARVKQDDGIAGVYTHLMASIDRMDEWRGVYFAGKEETSDTADNFIRKVNEEAKHIIKGIKQREAVFYAKEKKAQYFKKRDAAWEAPVKRERDPMRRLSTMVRDLKSHYPYVSEKNRIRLAKLVLAKHRSGMMFGIHSIDFKLLQAAGIPATEIAGPWCVIVPKEYVKLSPNRFESPDASDFLGAIGLDPTDGELAEGLMNYYRMNKKTPGIEWCRRAANLLEADRRKNRSNELLVPIEAWLVKKASIRPRKLPPGWKYLGPGDGQEIIDRSQKDGLCLADTLARISEGNHDVLDLQCLIAKGRTVVGLDIVGVCRNEHYACGKGNEVDDEAWALFSKDPA